MLPCMTCHWGLQGTNTTKACTVAVYFSRNNPRFAKCKICLPYALARFSLTRLPAVGGTVSQHTKRCSGRGPIRAGHSGDECQESTGHHPISSVSWLQLSPGILPSVMRDWPTLARPWVGGQGPSRAQMGRLGPCGQPICCSPVRLNRGRWALVTREFETIAVNAGLGSLHRYVQRGGTLISMLEVMFSKYVFMVSC